MNVDMNFVQGELDDLLNLESGLTDWEVGFIESVDVRLRDGRLPLTDKQIAKTHELWDRNCA